MGFFSFFNKKIGPKAQARKVYENAVRLTGSSKAVRAVKVRVALRCTDVLDQIFDEGMRKTIGFDEAVMIAVAGGEATPAPLKATMDTCYKTIETAEGRAVGYVPFKYAQRMYELGWGYQQKTVPPDDAFELAQLIAEEMATELRLSVYAVQPIEPLSWLRD